MEAGLNMLKQWVGPTLVWVGGDMRSWWVYFEKHRSSQTLVYFRVCWLQGIQPFTLLPLCISFMLSFYPATRARLLQGVLSFGQAKRVARLLRKEDGSSPKPRARMFKRGCFLVP